MTSAIYLLSYAALPLFGMLLAAHRVTGIDSRAARIGFAFLAGALLLTIEATIFSIAGIRWNVIGLSLPLVAASLTVLLWPRIPSSPPQLAGRRTLVATHVANAIVLISVLHFALSIITTQSVSPDYVLFWGVKAVRFAAAAALDPGFLLSRFPPPHVDYPPLVPVVQAWGLLFSRRMPWITAAGMSTVWLVAPIPFIRWSLERAFGRDFAAAVSAFWAAAMAASFAYSGCGGNADATLVAYISVAGVAIIAERYDPRSRWIAAAAFAGAALTKAEALAFIGAMLFGIAVRDLLRRDASGVRRVALLTLSTAASISIWFGYQYRFGLPVGYHRFTNFQGLLLRNLPVILTEAPKGLSAGCWGMSWLIPAAVLICVAVRSPRRLIDALPLLISLPLLFAFFAFLYLQYTSGLAMQMSWTLPRVSQPLLSLLILGTAFASGPLQENTGRGEPRPGTVGAGSLSPPPA